MERDLVDLQVADVSDLRWEELVEEMIGPDSFLNQCGSCATCYGPCFDCGQGCLVTEPTKSAE